MEKIAVIMAGGKGTRLYPISSDKTPKQFLPLLSEKPMIDETIDRIKPIFGPDLIFICSVMKYIGKVKNKAHTKILEPQGRGTTYSVLYCVLEVLERYGDGIIHLIPSDHHIEDLKKYHEALLRANEKAMDFNKIVLLGVKPSRADSGLGYIRRVGHRITDFREKPNEDFADYLIRCGYLWNTGHFIFKASVMYRQFKVYQPEILRDFEFCYKHRCLDSLYRDLTPVNIEKSIIERSKRLAVIPSRFKWSDIGTIDRLIQVWREDEVTYAEKIKAYERINSRSRKPD